MLFCMSIDILAHCSRTLATVCDGSARYGVWQREVRVHTYSPVEKSKLEVGFKMIRGGESLMPKTSSHFGEEF